MRRNQQMPGLSKSEALLRAVSKTVETSGRVVLFSGALLGATLSGALQFSLYYASTMSLAIMLNAMFAALGAVVLLPALYLCLGEKVFCLSCAPPSALVPVLGFSCRSFKRATVPRSSGFATISSVWTQYSWSLSSWSLSA